MPFSRFMRIVLLAPPLGGALLGGLTLLLTGLLLSHHSHGADRASAVTIGLLADTSKIAPATRISATSIFNPAVSDQKIGAEVPANRKQALSMPRGNSSTIFRKSIAPATLKFLDGYVAQPANVVSHDTNFQKLVHAVVPYAPFHLGIDMPLPNALESMLGASPSPVVLRDGRYVIVTGRRDPGGRGRAFLWVDMQQGIALGGIFFYPSNGEPSPTLTLFSSQISRDSVHIAQFPSAFLNDLAQWSKEAAIPPLTTRYFISASSEKTVLAHEEVCRPPLDVDPAAQNCVQQKMEAAAIDREAGAFLANVHYASNGTQRMVGDPLFASTQLAH